MRIKTLWRLPNPALGISRTDHMAEWDDLPSDWAHRTARIIADLRSQLDNLVFDLVTRAAGRELEEREAAALSFPVDEDQRPLSAASLAKRVGFLTDAARVVILEAQPSWHDAGMDYRRSTLWQLNKLNNLDKHRTMNVAATAQVASRGDQSKVFAEGEILIAAPDFWGEGFCDEGCVYDATVTYGSPGPSGSYGRTAR